jgi:predicted ATPase/DNA-binding SARP family transcriptional activator
MPIWRAVISGRTYDKYLPLFTVRSGNRRCRAVKLGRSCRGWSYLRRVLVRMLGPFEVSGPEGAAVVVAGRSQRTVLALLALHAGRPVGVHALTDALWPDGAPASARNSLQSHVARLRAALGAPGMIALSPAGYCLAVGREQVDVLRFEDLVRAGALGEALDLWRGTPLPEFDGEPFRGVAERLAGLRREALADLVHAGGAADRLWEAAADDPCWERGATVLATSLAHRGRRGEALEVLRRHADAVVDRLGLDPSEGVRLLQVAILRGDSPAPVVGTPDSGWSPGPVRKASVPLRFSSFLGRESEQSRLAGLLAEPGLVTVTGPGGVGKTRLVAETVRAGSRVAWVDAADVSAADFLAAVATGVGARIGPLDDALETIGRHAAGFTVVVLDNCEHVVEPAAAVVEAMHGVRVVVTSQERLRVDGERLLALGPLDQPAALRLFADRAGVSTGDPVIVERLDRLPLAIELAATQAAALGVDELRERLDDRLDLLVRGGRTSTARHRTLRAVVEWSFGLLDPSSRRVLTRLSAFAGSFTVAQAEAVVAADGVAAVLAALVDRSLVVRHGPGRFRLLETIRGYASSLLGDDRDALYRRHADVMLATARRLDRAFRGPSQAEAVRELDALLPDLRLAVLRSDRAGDLAAALYRYGYRCQQYEVLAWGRSAGDQPDARAAAATHAWGRGDLAEARALADGFESDAIHEVLGDVALVSCDATTALRHYRAMGTEPVHRVSGLVGEALVLGWSGRVSEAVAVAGAAVDLAASTGNPGARAEALYGLGEALGDTDPGRALTVLAEAAHLAATVDERLFLGAAETAAVAIGSRHGDPAAALSAFREVLAMWRRVGNDTLRAAALRNLVVLLVRVGADETAVLVDAALPPAGVYPAEQARLDRARAAAAERLGADREAALRRRGALLSPAQVHDEASSAIDAALSRMAG